MTAGVWVIEAEGGWRTKVVVGDLTTYSLQTWSDATEAARAGAAALATALLRVKMGGGL